VQSTPTLNFLSCYSFANKALNPLPLLLLCGTRVFKAAVWVAVG